MLGLPEIKASLVYNVDRFKGGNMEERINSFSISSDEIKKTLLLISKKDSHLYGHQSLRGINHETFVSLVHLTADALILYDPDVNNDRWVNSEAVRRLIFQGLDNRDPLLKSFKSIPESVFTVTCKLLGFPLIEQVDLPGTYWINRPRDKAVWDSLVDIGAGPYQSGLTFVGVLSEDGESFKPRQGGGKISSVITQIIDGISREGIR
jgi:hypothetical protein